MAKKLTWKETENNCWEITSHSTNSKYGHSSICTNGEPKGIHRHIYEECFGEIPKGMVVRHKCDNGKCINPEHLEIGTQQDNVDDMIKRGRWKTRPRSIDKLSDSQKEEIKSKYNKENTTYRLLAKEYDVPISTIRKVIKE